MSQLTGVTAVKRSERRAALTLLPLLQPTDVGLLRKDAAKTAATVKSAGRAISTRTGTKEDNGGGEQQTLPGYFQNKIF